MKAYLIDCLRRMNPNYFKNAIGIYINQNIVDILYDVPNQGKREGSFYIVSKGKMAFIHHLNRTVWFYNPDRNLEPTGINLETQDIFKLKDEVPSFISWRKQLNQAKLKVAQGWQNK